jgi:hypothetical protein
MSGDYLLNSDYYLNTITPISTDYIGFYDISGTAQGKCTIETLLALGGGGSSQWTTDTYGITYASNVGVGTASLSDVKIYASATTGFGLYGYSNSGQAIHGQSVSSYGIYGASYSGIGVSGVSNSNFGGDFTGLGCRATKFYVSSLNTAPSSASDTGTTGEIRFTADYIYVCTATNTWKRTAIATW